MVTLKTVFFVLMIMAAGSASCRANGPQESGRLPIRPDVRRGLTVVLGFDMEITDRALPESSRGQQGWLLNDLNGSGTPDLAMILRDGELWVTPLTLPDDRPGLSLQVLAPENSDFAGTINISGYLNDHPLGARSLQPGDAGAFFWLRLPRGYQTQVVHAGRYGTGNKDSYGRPSPGIHTAVNRRQKSFGPA